MAGRYFSSLLGAWVSSNVKWTKRSATRELAYFFAAFVTSSSGETCKISMQK
jgi:hypothetical protein